MSKQKKEVAVAYPELAEAFRGGEVGTWSVTEGSDKRGEAFTNLHDRKFQVPSADTEAGRAVRAHELGHARISPRDYKVLEELAKVTAMPERAVVVAEELRVNNYLMKKGIDLTALTDGTEKESGIRAGTQALDGDYNAYNEAILFGTAMVGTPAFRQYIAGVRKANPELAKVLKETEKFVKRVFARANHYDIGATNIVEDFRIQGDKELRFRTFGTVTGERGFLDYNTQVLNVLRNFIKVPPQEGEYEAVEGEGGVDYEVGYKAGQFAPLVFDDTVLCSQQVKGSLGRKKRANNSGVSIGYPSRLLTDPERRIFRQKAKASGGVIVIDQSGSMEFGEDDLETILDVSPGALVIGYSHKVGSVGVPNAWVIARRGKRVATGSIPQGNVGNGVDGPILDYAIKHRRGNEPIIWVCDGQVTDHFDKPHKELNEIVANIVIKHGITQVPTPAMAISALRSGDRNGFLAGRVGRAVAELTGRPLGDIYSIRR